MAKRAIKIRNVFARMGLPRSLRSAVAAGDPRNAYLGQRLAGVTTMPMPGTATR
jgi:hypothetical protein